MKPKKNIKGFEEHRKNKSRKRKSDGSVESAHRSAQDRLRDWQTDAYRSQSGRREADVPPIN